MTAPLRETIPALFDMMAGLPIAERHARLVELEAEAPAVARELRTLFDADGEVGDFLGVLALDTARDTVAPPSDDASSGIRAGQSIGPYRAIRPLGQGGMAIVWLANDERLDRLVALKLVARVGAFQQTGDYATLVAEARLAARLDHRHIAAIYDVGETAEGDAYIAMSYCQGGSLETRLAGEALSVGDTVRIARQLAAAIGAAHSRGVLHHDVKPANVLFDADGNVRLADFGIARLAHHAARSAQLHGTAAYLAPEQLRDEPIDHRTDLWAFGVTLYEMLAGRRPFDGGSIAASLYGILTKRPEAIVSPAFLPDDHATPGAFSELTRLAFDLLEKDPAMRPASAAEVERRLEFMASQLGPNNTKVGVRESSTAAQHVESGATRGSVGAQLTPLVGRERELAMAATLLDRTRLLTFTGPGGTGKTRLAMELARLTNSAFANGVHVVTLASTTAPELVASAIAQTIGERESAAVRTEEQVVRYFAEAHALLVLDNFEHLLGAAPFVKELLSTAPRLTIIVTSRAPLGLRGEQELPVPPLRLPAESATTADAIGLAESVRLFVQRAQAVRPDFALTDDNAADVGAICRRLDGLPLAIELAATRIKLFAPRALRPRLEQRLDLLRSDAPDVEARHRTLRAVVDWSYDLLGWPEQALLRKLSVFVGGFTLDAVAAIAGVATPERPVEALDGIATLVNRSLVVQRDQVDSEPRFFMLETIREFALERLRDAGEESSARAAHLAHFLAFAEQAAPHLRGPSQVQWLARLERDHDNLRAALDTAIADDVFAASRLAVALHWFWLGSRGFLGHSIDQLASIDQRLRTSEAERVPADLHARLLTTLGLLTGVRGDHFSVPDAFHAASLPFYEQAGDANGMATTLNHLGWSSYMLGRIERGAELSRAALERHRANDNPIGVAAASVNLGWVAMSKGDPVEAERLFTEALVIHRARGDRRACAYAMGHVATAAMRHGEHDRAIAGYNAVDAIAEPLGDRVLAPTFRSRREVARYENGAPADQVLAVLERELMPVIRESGHAWSIGFVLATIGRVYADAGELDRARATLEESLATRAKLGDLSGVAESEARLADVARRRGDRRSAAAWWRESLRKRIEMGEGLAIAESFEGIARLVAEDIDDGATRDDAARPNALKCAAELLAGAASARKHMATPVSPRDRDGITQLRRTLATRLDEDLLQDAETRGASLSTDALAEIAFTLLA